MAFLLTLWRQRGNIRNRRIADRDSELRFTPLSEFTPWPETPLPAQ
jgi:hypothetical protein